MLKTMKQALFTMGTLRKGQLKNVYMGSNPIKKELNILDNLMEVSRKELVLLLTLKVISKKVIGLKVNSMALVSTFTKTVQNTWVIGKTTHNMVTVRKIGPIIPVTKAST